MKVTGSRLLVEQFQMDEVTQGGIALPSQAVQDLPFGRILQVGPDAPPIFKVWDVIMFPNIGPTCITLQNQRYLLVEPEDVLAILEEGEY